MKYPLPLLLTLFAANFLTGQVIKKSQIVACGQHHTAYIKQDNTLWGLGSNTNGELNQNRPSSFDNPQLISSDIVAVDIGVNHTLFLKSNGDLWSIGGGLDLGGGQFFGRGDGTWATPDPLLLGSEVTDFTAAPSTSLFVKSDGSLYAMGDNSYGQLGMPIETVWYAPLTKIMDGVHRVFAGDSYSGTTHILDNGGNLWITGWIKNRQFGVENPVVYNGAETDLLDSFTQVPGQFVTTSPYPDTSFLVKRDGTLWATGFVMYKPFYFDLSGPSFDEPVQIYPELFTSVKSVKTFTTGAVVLLANGDLYSIGVIPEMPGYVTDLSTLSREEYARKFEISYNTPFLLDTDVIDFDASITNCVWVKSDGTLWGVGVNGFGSLGVNPSTTLDKPVLIDTGLMTSNKNHVIVPSFGYDAPSNKPYVPIPLYYFSRNDNPSFFFTANEGEKDIVLTQLAGSFSFKGPSQQVIQNYTLDSKPVYRLYNTVSGAHFYTASKAEVQSILVNMGDIFTLEGIAFFVFHSQIQGTLPVYRFFIPETSSHFFTINELEKDNLIKSGQTTLVYEGVAWYAYPL